MNPSDKRREQDEFLVSQYLDGTLDETRRPEFERRLATDGELAGLLREYRALDSAIGWWAEHPPELDWPRFEAAVRKGRRRLDAPGRRVPGVYRLFVPLAAAASIVFAFALWRSTPSREVATVAVVTLGAPADVERTDADFQVTYGYRESAREDYVGSSPGPVVLAKAAVGSQVRWPQVDEQGAVN